MNFRLMNYWWLLIWCCGIGFLCNFLPKKTITVNKKKKEVWSWAAIIILTAPFVLWAGYRAHIGDTEAYRLGFRNAPSSLSEIGAYLENVNKDKGFSIFIVLFKSLFGNNDILYFSVIALFQMFSIVYIYRKYSENFLLSFFLFVVSTDYISWVMNGMRQFIVVCAIMLCSSMIIKRKYGILTIIILLLSTIHGSAIMMIPVIFVVQGESLNWRTIVAVFVITLAVFYTGQFTSILENILDNTQYDSITSNSIWIGDDGTNVIRVLVYSVPAILAVIGKDYINEAKNTFMDLCVNMSLISAALYVLSSVTSGVYIGRLPIYCSLYGYIVMPWLIDTMFNERSAHIVKNLMIVLYLIFFYYQMHFTWKLL